MERSSGFSLVELMVGLGVAAILISVAVPGFENVTLDNRRDAALMQLMGAIQLARSEAVKRRETVVLCKSGDGASCASGGAIGWADGRLVFSNLDEDDPPAVDAGETVIRVYPALSDTSALVAEDLVASTEIDALAFDAAGETEARSLFTYCDGRGASEAQGVLVARTGRPRIVDSYPDGGALVCP